MINLEDVPVIDYDALAAEYQAEGIDLTDMLGAFNNGVLIDPAPPYVNFWHQLMALTDFVPWIEKRGRRTKQPPIGPAMVVVPKDPTEEELAEGRKRLEAKAGPVPDEAWEQVAADVRQRRVRAEKALEVITDAAERYGIEVPELGKIVRITMTVDC